MWPISGNYSVPLKNFGTELLVQCVYQFLSPFSNFNVYMFSMVQFIDATSLIHDRYESKEEEKESLEQ